MLLFALISALAAPPAVALTFDDLPSQTKARGKASQPDPQVQRQITDALLSALREHQAPATVFVNCGLLHDDALVERWRDAGMQLGNHTSTHVRAASVPLEAWQQDVRACHERLARVAGTPPGVFRYPYLRRGDPERRAAQAAFLAQLGERVAPVTAATAEWRLAQLYDATDDPDRRAVIRALLVEHVQQSLRVAAEQVQQRHQLEVPHILLLHVNALGADTLGALLAALREDGVRFVTLDHALKDPYYDRPDVQPGDHSLPWQLRIEPAWQPGEPNWFHTVEGSIAAEVDARAAAPAPAPE